MKTVPATETYEGLYRQSITDPEAFWKHQSEHIHWFRKPDNILSQDENGFYRWYEDGTLNTCYLAVDHHVEEGRGEQNAIVYDSPVTGELQKLTYRQLLERVSRFAGGLQKLGVQKGDTVVIYMPMVPEAIIAMLACARIGAIHSVVFGGFAAHELALRIDDAKPKVLITASCGIEVCKVIPYKPLVESAIAEADHKPAHLVMLDRSQHPVTIKSAVNYADLFRSEPAGFVEVKATDPLYILYTSGTTGKPKGIVRDNGGHAVAMRFSMKYVYGLEPGDTFFAASDIGWVVGHSYIVYAPLIHGCTTILFEGKPIKTPDAGTFWRIVQQHNVKALFTAPTAIRAIRKEDPEGSQVKKYDISSLQTLFLAGERCDVTTLEWAREKLVVPVIDHWWQTETGWAIVANMRGLETLPVKPGSATRPVCGYDIKILNEQGVETALGEEGYVAAKLPLPPGTLPTLWKDDERFRKGYLERFPGYYFSGDGGYKDEDGYVFITGRVDDVINVAGHRLSTAEMEEIVAAHPDVAECAVIGINDSLRGQVPLGLVVLKSDSALTEQGISDELVRSVRQQVGAIACFKRALVVQRLPKTRSGKILRRTMRAIANGEEYKMPSTIEDPAVLDEIKAVIISPLPRQEEQNKELLTSSNPHNPMSYRINSWEEYQDAYKKSVEDPEKFWEDIAENFSWHQKWDKVLEWNFEEPSVKWFLNGKLNITENCLDRHLKSRGNKLALIWEPNDPKEKFVRLTYKELHDEVCKFANVLKRNGAKKGDRICIYMPMIPELAIAVLACARIGAVHSVVFAGFSAQAIAGRVNDASCSMVITSDGLNRGTKQIPVKRVVDEALEQCESVKKVIVVERLGWAVNMVEGRDVWYHEELKNVTEKGCTAEVMDSEDMLFILYTSGSTGKPKGVVHSCGGYMVYTDYTFRNVFQYDESDVYWCTADIGWITGHSYIIYGPLLAGATTVMFEGVPTYPDNGRFWQVCDKHGVNQFYTAPTAIRALMAGDVDDVLSYSLDSLKVLGSVGEPINEEAWQWYHLHVGKEKCPIVDTWWQTETGGIMISPLPGITELKPAHATYPLPGVQPVLVDSDGNEIEGNDVEGHLCIKFPWPSMIRTTYGDHERCRQTYFSTYKGKYFTGDGARRDKDGMYRIIGRVDDVINVSGHRFGTAEIESAINEHPKVVESAVVGYPHDIKGQGIYAYVITSEEIHDEENVRGEIVEKVVEMIGKIAKPEKIQFVKGLPKTRSGKIMRRILRKVAEGDTSNLGDTTTLLDPDVVDDIKAGAL